MSPGGEVVSVEYRGGLWVAIHADMTLTSVRDFAQASDAIAAAEVHEAAAAACRAVAGAIRSRLPAMLDNPPAKRWPPAPPKPAPRPRAQQPAEPRPPAAPPRTPAPPAQGVEMCECGHGKRRHVNGSCTAELDFEVCPCTLYAQAGTGRSR